jgi:hypothetical protein
VIQFRRVNEAAPPALSALALIAVALACGDDAPAMDGGTPDAGGRDTSGADTGGVDTAPPDTAPPRGDAAISDPCAEDGECLTGLFCLESSDGPWWPTVGFCTKLCAGDAQCGAGATCTISVPIDPALGSTVRLCMRSCEIEEGCATEGRVCSDVLNGTQRLGWPVCIPGDADAGDGSPCESFAECAAGQRCLAPAPFDRPGGLCVTPCTVDMPDVCQPRAGETSVCASLPEGAFCLEACSRTDECSRRTEGYECVDGACRLSYAGPGAACVVDSDCGPPETPWTCLTGAEFPSGYCSRAGCDRAVADDCPLRTSCYDPTLVVPGSGDEHCAVICATDDECRMTDGYRCVRGDPARPDLRVCRVP